MEQYWSIAILGLGILSLVLWWEDKFRPFKRFKNDEALMDAYIELERIRRKNV